MITPAEAREKAYRIDAYTKLIEECMSEIKEDLKEGDLDITTVPRLYKAAISFLEVVMLLNTRLTNTYNK